MTEQIPTGQIPVTPEALAVALHWVRLAKEHAIDASDHQSAADHRETEKVLLAAEYTGYLLREDQFNDF